MALGIAGVDAQREYKRYYPAGEVAAHLVGFTNIDDQGQEGIELAFNSWLQGESGSKRVLKDRLGRTVVETKDGKRLDSGIVRAPGEHTNPVNRASIIDKYREFGVTSQKRRWDCGADLIVECPAKNLIFLTAGHQEPDFFGGE